jgi:hypothetical protein
MALETAIEGGRHTAQSITFARADDATQNLTGATLSGTIKNIRTGVERAITGTLALGTPASGIFTWTYSAGDLVAGDYQVQFVATYGDATVDRSVWSNWTVQPAAASTSTQPRATMLALIQRTKQLLGPCADDTLSDSDIQDALDRYRIKLNLLQLMPLDTVMPGGQVRYYEFTAPFTDWEQGYIIQASGNQASGATLGDGSAWQAVTPTVAYDLDGRWRFADYFFCDLFITGYSYDVYAAAASCVDQLAATQLRTFSFTAGGQTFNKNQILQNYREFARDLRRQARLVSADMVRGDVWSGG